MKRYLMRSLILCTQVLSGCGLLMSDHSGTPVQSPSGKYAVFSTVNRTNRSRPDYAYVVIHLTDGSGKELHVYRSRAGDANKWALGWMPEKDVVILQSSDVGAMAFRIDEERLLEISHMSDEMSTRAKVLKAEKYGTPNKPRE